MPFLRGTEAHHRSIRFYVPQSSQELRFCFRGICFELDTEDLGVTGATQKLLRIENEFGFPHG